MLLRLELQNFKQHEQLVVNFTTGLNVLQGDNGKGKSNVLRGILYALGGASAVGSRDHLANWAGGQMLVTLDIQLPEAGEVRVKRGLTQATVSQGDTVLASGQTPVTAYLEEALGMSVKVLRTLLCAEQGEAQGLLKMGAAGLQTQLETVARIEVIDNILSMLSTDLSFVSGELKGMGEPYDLEAMKSDLNEVLHDEQVADRNLVEATVLRVKAVDRLEVAEKRLTPLLAQRTQYKQLFNSIGDKLQQINDWQEEVRVQTSTLPNADEEELAAHVTQLIADNNEIRYQLKEAAKWLTGLTTKEAIRNVAAKDLDKMLLVKDLAEQFVKAKRVSEANADEVYLRKTALDSAVLDKEKGSCRTCNRPFEATDTAHLETKVKEAEAALVIATQNYELARHDYIQLQVVQKEAGASSNLLENWQSFYDDTKRQHREAQDWLDQAGDKPDTELLQKALEEGIATESGFTHQLTVLRQRKQALARAQTNLAAAQGELDKLRKALSELPTELEERCIAATDELNEAKVEFQARDEAAKIAKDIYSAAKHSKEVAEAAYTKAIEIEQRRTEKRSREKLLADLAAFLRKNRGTLMQEAWVALTGYASHLIDNTTEGLMKNLSRDAAGAFYLDENGRTVPVSELSGARKSITGLCLRIALANTFYGTSGFTLLDEITADCTEENAARVAGLLQSLRSQIIMVSHRQSDALNAQNVISL